MKKTINIIINKKRKAIICVMFVCIFAFGLLMALKENTETKSLDYVYTQNGEDVLTAFLETPVPNTNLTYEETYLQYDSEGKWAMTEKINGNINITFTGTYNCVVPDTLMVEYTLYPMEENSYVTQCTSVNYFGGGM